jgi:Tol biopolymer transport system component/DNA-binding winged helix-turn-helix (wHTH) protein
LNGDQPVHLTDTEFRLIVTLLCGEVPPLGTFPPPLNSPITTSELTDKVWGRQQHDTVDTGRLTTHVRNLKLKLGKTDNDIPLIRNSRDQGYFLTVPVERVELNESSVENGAFDPLQSKTIASLEHSEKYRGVTEPQNAIPIVWIASVTLTCLTLAILLFLLQPKEATVVRYTELTNDGRPKWGPIFTDGKRIFFSEGVQTAERIVSIPLSGGKPTPLPIPPRAVLEDISSDGKHLLVRSAWPTEDCIWQFSLRDNSLKRLLCGANAAAWRRGGSISFLRHDHLFDQELGHSSSRDLGVIGPANHMRWSPDGKTLRFDLGDLAGERRWLVELAHTPVRLEHLEHGQRTLNAGTWSADGRYFFYHANSGTSGNIWVENVRGLNPFAPMSFQLTNGPGSWSWPTLRDNRTLFAIHLYERPALVHFNPETNQWDDMWDGSSDYELDYSPDRQWVAFTHEPDHTVWKSKLDGTQRTQLTKAGLTAYQPHWSRDGRQIAFMGQNAKSEYRIFVVPANGGASVELQPQGEDQGVATWSPDNGCLLFGERLGRKPRAQMRLHVLDLHTRKIESMNGTNGLWSPRWSPDGKSIMAVSTDNKTIRVSKPDAMSWRDVASFGFVDNVTWSYDSRYLYCNGWRKPGTPFFVYRVGVATGAVETLANLGDFQMPGENWFGVSPNGELLASKDFVHHEICELDYRLP